ncbi:hypothetical protein MMC13_003411 [Lambiella insularis]|nr:hypothetical protein [Lambiella insularis]
MNRTSKANQIPVKEAGRKFSCPNCNKTYLHAKHLKRHMWRHTGDRPYMCMFCTSTFSRSDILKRHFQKCSMRRGNPTGASHLSDPAANFETSQAAAAEAATDSLASTATPTTGGVANGRSTTGSMGPAPMTTTYVPYSDGSPMQYNMAKAPANDMYRQPQFDTGRPSP